jgi:toxin ParE1/3/4
MRLIYHDEAEEELAEAARFYQARSPGLGERLLDDFAAAIAENQKSPGLWPVVEGDLRSRTLRRFPFSVYYRVEGEQIRILVFKHHRQHPDYWRHRLDD